MWGQPPSAVRSSEARLFFVRPEKLSTPRFWVGHLRHSRQMAKQMSFRQIPLSGIRGEIPRSLTLKQRAPHERSQINGTRRSFTAAGVPPPEGLTCLRSPLDGEVEAARFPSSDAARSFRSPAIHPCHPPNTPLTQMAARNRAGRPVAVDVRSAPRAEELGNCETSTEDRRAEKKKASHTGGRSESVPAPHRPPVFRSTYLGPPVT